jgi:glycosyltransferase involved in cell wall biosynthesis
MKPVLTIHLMTAALTPGDALGKNFLTLRQLFTEFGCRVNLYADWISSEYPAPAYHSSLYQSTGRDVLWYQYSIGADNIACVTQSSDYRVMDFQGVSPARLVAGYDPYLELLCRQGEERLPQMHDQFDLCVVHSDYSRQLLEEAGFRQRIEKLPMVADTARYDGHDDVTLSAYLRQIEYVMFVGRVVPQKDILALLRIFAELHKLRPEAILIIPGRRDLAPGYQREIDRTIAQLRLGSRVLFLGQVNDLSILSSLYRHARFTLIMSDWESFCVPVVESMSFGTPVVACDVPPVPEIMGEGGIVIDKHGPCEAAQRIVALWSDSPQRERLQTAARARAHHFTTEVLRRELLAMLTRVFRASSNT